MTEFASTTAFASENPLDHTRAAFALSLEEIQAARAATADRLSTMFAGSRRRQAVGRVAIAPAPEADTLSDDELSAVSELAVGEYAFDQPKPVLRSVATNRPADLYPGPEFYQGSQESWQNLTDAERRAALEAIDHPKQLGIPRKSWKKWSLEDRALALHHRYVRVSQQAA